MHSATPWDLPQNRHEDNDRSLPQPWARSGRSELSHRTAHDEAYFWDSIPELAGDVLGNDTGAASGIEVQEQDDAARVAIDLPDLDSGKIRIFHHANVLQVSGKSKDESTEFRKTIELDGSLDWDKSRAELEGTRLEIKVPKAA